nr:hypothetical protein [uncultured archaeon]
MLKKKGQIWVETVLYTLIGLALIGITLAIMMPKITQSREKVVVEQSIESLNSLDGKIVEVVDYGPGNLRNIEELGMKKGELYFNYQDEDKIVLLLDELNYPYSEPGITITRGRVEIVTEGVQGKYRVLLTLDYEGFVDLTYNGEGVEKKFNAAPVPYSFIVENTGVSGIETEVDIRESSEG